ncbi:MAG TPA: phospholipase D-like domain-containing protein [Phenylobacterium sp.]|uniref:phospholipase D-like domain-containing protein n=1 Tax=Phenylobacterium sp. TaxID=1871053 RepID=UPI002B9E0351|nr:phospholipase D-like domain-containing protein [Phenylobacterium sp.]HSV01821.1 phospholipase D-like domain-containing protein [Phenylobacterium sp.]
MQLFAQLRNAPFGPILAEELGSAAVTSIDIATAWVRASGLVHLQAGLRAAIDRGAALRVVVGIDAENTSEEGLRGLLELAASGAPNQMPLFVRHNEAGPLFHPKLYVFRDPAGVRAYIGSNNFTRSGLYLNDELSIRVGEARGTALDAELETLIGRYTNLEDGLNRRLDAALLAQLIDRGYIKAEARLIATASARSRRERTHDPLFGVERRRAPAVVVPVGAPVVIAEAAPADLPVRDDWQRLYLRLRLARGTQGQIPKAVVKEMRRRMGQEDDEGVLILKDRNGAERRISPTHPEDYEGAVNTYKFEAVAVHGEPILHIYPVGDDLIYEFLDSDTDPLGHDILEHLQAGFEDDPPTTLKTNGPVERTTWFRFD